MNTLKSDTLEGGKQLGCCGSMSPERVNVCVCEFSVRTIYYLGQSNSLTGRLVNIPTEPSSTLKDIARGQASLTAKVKPFRAIKIKSDHNYALAKMRTLSLLLQTSHRAETFRWEFSHNNNYYAHRNGCRTGAWVRRVSGPGRPNHRGKGFVVSPKWSSFSRARTLALGAVPPPGDGLGGLVWEINIIIQLRVSSNKQIVASFS